MHRFYANRKIGVLSTLLLLSMSLMVASAARAADVIDRIVATVNGHIILQSDWEEALCYEALLSGRSPAQFSDDDRRAVLDRLIDQELLGEQMKSASFQHASEAEAATQVAQARKLYPEAATAEGWDAVLARYGLTEKALTAHVQQQIDLMRLVDARLRPAVQIDSKSIEAYYREKFVPQLKESGGGEVSLADVSGKIRELLTEEKVNELMVSWLQSLRSESKVSVPGASESQGEGVQTR
ncbi:MAG TPA: SurA N-terminal domain-containing protein [Candidatus Sulfotelmatobacter sp.]|nr:SurA N-terminal domain-containing protein [Candidatus Sulfotelmatobacter sp.]